MLSVRRAMRAVPVAALLLGFGAAVALAGPIEDRQQLMKMNGKAPDHVLVVGVERVFGHCPKCMIRSGLWRPDTWGDPTAVPSVAEMLVAHAKPQKSVDQMQTIIERGNKERLY